MSNEHPKYWILWWWGAVLGGTALGYGLLHFVYLGDQFFGMLAFVSAPFVQGFVVAYLIAKAKASGSLGIVGASVVSTILLMWLLVFVQGEGGLCIFMASPIWLAFALIGTLIGKRVARIKQGGSLAVGIVPFAVFTAYHLDNSLPTTVHYVETTLEIDASPGEIWPLLFNLEVLDEPETWYFRAGVACPMGTSTDFESKTRLCHLTTGDLVEKLEVINENRELRWRVLHTPDTLKEWNPFSSKEPEHVAHSFRVLEGGFRLRALPSGRTLLTGWTTYRSDIAPNMYWDIWNRLIVGGVQERVMKAIDAKATDRLTLTAPTR